MHRDLIRQITSDLAGVAPTMRSDANNRRDYWYLSLIPVLACVAYYCAWRVGIAPTISGWPAVVLPGIPVGLSIDPSLMTPPAWAGNVRQAVGANAVGLGVLVAALACGVVLFTWLTILAIDAKRAAHRLATEYRDKRRGNVTGILRPPEPSQWSSALILDEEPEPYRTRLGSWIRHTYLNDRTSGALRHD